MASQNPTPGVPYHVLRLALGLVYFHFGILKFFPDLSPAEMLASQTIMRLTGGALDASHALQYLAIMECAIGLALIFDVGMRVAFVAFLLHMLGTFSPLFVLPELTFKISPLAPTMEGQYILKNLVFVAAGWAVFAPYVFRKKPSYQQALRQQADFKTIAIDMKDSHHETSI
jgi:uncharacterized membrane protein YkgB